MPQQGLNGEPVKDFSIEGSQISLTIPLVLFNYTGLLEDGQQNIDGFLNRGESKIKVRLKKVEKISSKLRPQTPQKPYPYLEQEVKFLNQKEKITLAGTLTFPASGGPFPAAVLISGAGPQDRNEEGFGGHRPFHVLADYLTRRGIAVLRYDDRGVGESTGSQEKSTSLDLAGDAVAAVRFLLTQHLIHHEKIGLIGHSEGGDIAQILAGRMEGVAFIVLMAGTALPGREIFLYQLKKASEFTAPVKDFAKHAEKILAILEEDPDDESAREKIYSTLVKEVKMPVSIAESLADHFLEPWNRYFFTVKDPVGILSRVKCPVLALGGEKDVHIPTSQNLRAVEEILNEAGNRNYKTIEFPDLNHLFQTAVSGLVVEYYSIEETIAPDVLRTIGDWILGLVK